MQIESSTTWFIISRHFTSVFPLVNSFNNIELGSLLPHTEQIESFHLSNQQYESLVLRHRYHWYHSLCCLFFLIGYLLTTEMRSATLQLFILAPSTSMIRMLTLSSGKWSLKYVIILGSANLYLNVLFPASCLLIHLWIQIACFLACNTYNNV